MKRILSFGFVGLLFGAVSALAVESQTVPRGSSNPDDFVKVGGAGSGFLKIGIGARGAAMGGAHGALVNDLSAIHWNPAGVAQVNGVSAYASTSPYFADFAQNFAAMSYAINDQFVIAGHFNTFGATGIPITTLLDDQGTGATYDIADMSFGVTFAGYLTEQFAFGITSKFVRNAFATLGATNVAFDVGTQYDTELYGLKIGFSIHNLGGQMQYTGSDLATTDEIIIGDFRAPIDAEYLTYPYSMPLTFRAGVGAEVWRDDVHALSAEADFITFADTPEQAAFGAEYAYDDLFFLRTGYLLNHDQLGFSWGVGFNYATGNFDAGLDYSMDMTDNLGLIHRLNVDILLDN